VGDGGADLALDVVADDRDAGGGELVGPRLGAGDEDREGVDERDAGVERGLGVELGGVLRADGQVADEDVGLRLPQGGDDVDRLLVGLLDGLAVVLAEAVEVLFSLTTIASARSNPTFLASTSNAATNSMSETW
jgi:hypothetical protein